MEDIEQLPQQKTSKFNSAQLKLLRLHGLWSDAHTHSRNGNLQKWNIDLDRAWLEMIAMANDTDVKKFQEIGCKLAKNKDNYFVLMEKEIFLRRLEDRSGLGNAYSDPNEDDF